jgi:hypothetical protein
VATVTTNEEPALAAVVAKRGVAACRLRELLVHAETSRRLRSVACNADHRPRAGVQTAKQRPFCVPREESTTIGAVQRAFSSRTYMVESAGAQPQRYGEKPHYRNSQRNFKGI